MPPLKSKPKLRPLKERERTDNENNTIRGGDIQLHNSKDNIVILESGRECIINGLTGYIVVESDNSLLICNKADEQEIKKFISKLKSNQ